RPGRRATGTRNADRGYAKGEHMRRGTQSWIVASLVLAPLAGCVHQGSQPSATNSATGHNDRVFNWTIDKSAAPDSFDLLNGETGTSQFTITVTKNPGGVTFVVDGEICVTNDGNETTEDLAITDQVLDPANAEAGALASVDVDVSARPALDAGES